MTPSDIEKIVKEKLPQCEAYATDLTGTQDHYQLVVVSPLFEGKKMIEQHRIVKALFDADIQSGEVHALSLKTYTPEEWSRRKQ